MQNTDMLLEHLQEYTIDEQIYRRYYELRHDPSAQADYVSGLDPHLIRSRNILIPGFSGVYFPQEIEEKDLAIEPKHSLTATQNDALTSDSQTPLFPGSSSVCLSKHYRYTPALEHSHTYFEIIYMLSGSCRQTLDGEDLPLHAGDICFIPPKRKHTLEIFDESIAINLMLRRNTFEYVFFNVLSLDSVLSSFFMSSLYSRHPMKRIVFSAGDDIDIRDSVLEMYLESQSQDKYSAFLLENMVPVFFARVLRKYSRSASILHERGLTNNAHAMALLTYINQHFRQISLQELADHFHYSTAHCSRLIKEETGRNFSSILRATRIDRACNLLNSTGQSIAGISEEVGYENPETFIRAFQRQMKMSPTTYRKNRPQNETIR